MLQIDEAKNWCSEVVIQRLIGLQIMLGGQNYCFIVFKITFFLKHAKQSSCNLPTLPRAVEAQLNKSFLIPKWLSFLSKLAFLTNQRSKSPKDAITYPSIFLY